MRRAALGGGQRDTHDPDHDRAHGQMLASPGALAEHALAEEQQHEQTHGHRGLHDHKRHEQQRDDL